MCTVKMTTGLLKIELHEYYPLFGVLFASFLVSVSLGRYQNWDALTEYGAASGVIQWGFPYTSPGILINQPPLGYYIDALFFKTFGLSYETGVWVATLFGLGSVFLMYEIGKILYEKRTGLVAAALFGLAPWQIVMSRTFLIDSQSLFFSLLYLLVGIWAIQKSSLRNFLSSGTLFGFALLTKAFAVFMLVPLLLVYINRRSRNRKHVMQEAALFFSPALFLNLLWYEVITEEGAFAIFRHNDFNTFFTGQVAPSGFFLANYFAENLGIFFIAACVLSLFLSLSQRRLLSKFLVSDLICFATIICILGFDAFLVLGKNLVVPYVSVIKYTYPALPAFCWLASSSLDKLCSLPHWKNFTHKQRILVFSIAIAGLFLALAAIGVNMIHLNWLTKWNYLVFVVEGEYGYSFNRLPPAWSNTQIASIQGVAFVLASLSLALFNQDKLKSIAQHFKDYCASIRKKRHRQ
jgi:4-amino-4-deoxy-L-arabinose transferase-like glycosyltransferase